MRWGPGESWDVDRGGVYTDGAWTFDLDEEKFPDGIDFKFVLAPGRWLQGGNQHLDAGQCVDTVDYELDDGPDLFEARQAAIIERGAVAQRLFVRNLPTSRSPATRPGRPFRAAGVQPRRALFWGGLIPRQAPWELDSWPAAVRDHLQQALAPAEA